MEWTDDVIAQLSLLWGEGHSAAEIGRRLGCTKSAVIGKVHRLDLPSRTSIIKPQKPWGEDKYATLRAMLDAGNSRNEIAAALDVHPDTISYRTRRIGSKLRRPPRPARPDSGYTPRPRPLPPMPRPVLVTAPRPVMEAPHRIEPPKPVIYGRVIECCWPIGEPGTRGFRFCAEPSAQGRVYCGVHCSVAYRPAGSRQADAA